MQHEEDKEFQKEAHHFYSSVLWLHPGCVNPVSHPHQIMHTHASKKKGKERKRKRKHTNVKCYVKCSFHSEQCSTISSLCAEKRGDPCWSVLYRHQFQNCDRRRQLVQHDRQTTWMPTRWDIISCKEYGTWYYLFIRPTVEPIAKDISQIEVMEHSRPIILYYTDSSAICVSLSLS